MTPEQIHRRLILGTVFEYILKAAAAAGAIYLIGWFFSWLCSLITIGMIPFLMGLIEAIGIRTLTVSLTRSQSRWLAAEMQ